MKKYLLPLLTGKVVKKPFKCNTSLFFWVWSKNQREEQPFIIFRIKICVHTVFINNIRYWYWWHQVCLVFCFWFLNLCFDKFLQNLKCKKNILRFNCLWTLCCEGCNIKFNIKRIWRLYKNSSHLERLP